MKISLNRGVKSRVVSIRLLTLLVVVFSVFLIQLAERWHVILSISSNIILVINLITKLLNNINLKHIFRLLMGG